MERIIGILAGTGTTISFLPQVVKVVETQSTKDLSPYMLAIHLSGAGLWIAYGVMRDDIIIAVFNLITAGLVSTLLLHKLKEITTNTTSLNNQDSTSEMPTLRHSASVYTLPDALGLDV